jgi:hypothetical protein
VVAITHIILYPSGKGWFLKLGMGLHMKFNIKGLVIVLVAGCASTVAFSQTTTVVRQLDQQMRQAIEQYFADSKTEVMSPIVDGLDEGGSDNYNLQLTSGRDYYLLGVCDNDCSDLDISLYNQNGQLVQEDTATDDKPMVLATPRANGRYQMRVTMASCSSEPCYYSVGVYRD